MRMSMEYSFNIVFGSRHIVLVGILVEWMPVSMQMLSPIRGC
jgi:hypothetical protein